MDIELVERAYAEARRNRDPGPVFGLSRRGQARREAHGKTLIEDAKAPRLKPSKEDSGV